LWPGSWIWLSSSAKGKIIGFMILLVFALAVCIVNKVILGKNSGSSVKTYFILNILVFLLLPITAFAIYNILKQL